jgi:hypothetical protein
MHHRLLAAALAFAAASAFADKVPLSDDEMSSVAGKGVAILVHLELNAAQGIDSRVAAGFTVDDTTTYAVIQNFGGLLNMFAITLDPSTNAAGQDYLAIGMPYYLAAKDFGAHAITVQTDPNAPVTAGFGSLLLNGSANMTGSLNVWPAK